MYRGINALVLKHFIIGLLSELRQQVRYEQMKMFDEATEMAKKKEVNMEEIPHLIMQSMVKEIQISIEPKSQKHLEMSSRMESALEQMINQMNQLSFHLL
jgi:hypothetical protein